MINTRNLLSVRNLKQYFPVKGKKLLKANEDISFDIKKGETYALVGESGCGKSTLGRSILQLYRPTAGSVFYYGGEREVDLCKLAKNELRGLRKELQVVFQDPYSSLNPRRTVGQAVEEGILTHGLCKDERRARERALKIFADCGLPMESFSRYPHQFSGGQRQRVCIARALAVEPKFIVCDECVSALDASVQSQILNLLGELKRKQSLTYLFISHDLSVVKYIADRVGVMYLGEIVEEGEVKEIFSRPAHPYTIALLSASPTLSGRKKRTLYLSGNMPSPVTPPTGCKFHTRCFMAREICKKQAPIFTEVKKGHFARCHFAEQAEKEKDAFLREEKGEKV